MFRSPLGISQIFIFCSKIFRDFSLVANAGLYLAAMSLQEMGYP